MMVEIARTQEIKPGMEQQARSSGRRIAEQSADPGRTECAPTVITRGYSLAQVKALRYWMNWL